MVLMSSLSHHHCLYRTALYRTALSGTALSGTVVFVLRFCEGALTDHSFNFISLDRILLNCISLCGQSLLKPHPWPTVSALMLAALIDFIVGDPWGWPHPVQAMGSVISRYRQPLISRDLPPPVMKIAGIGLTLLLVGGTAALSAWSLAWLNTMSPLLAWLLSVVWLASCFAGRSLRRAAEEVLGLLNQPEHGLQAARKQLAMYVGRDTQSLSKLEIRRAVLETVSENAVDGVLAPLFYALMGGLFGLAAPMALAYKAASTLDSMVGYREAPYTDLGWCSAKFEDGLTWLPCRLSVLTIAMLSGRPGSVLRLCWRDARADPSPNAGWSECVYAAALGVQLGGANTYQGKLKVKPTLGEAARPITDTVIAQALSLTRWSFVLGLGLGSTGLFWFASLWSVSL